MGRRLEEIEAEAAEVKRRFEAKWAREARIAKAVADFNAEHARPIPAGLELLMQKAGITPEDLQQFFDARAADAAAQLEGIVPLLQLTDGEVGHFEDWRREMMVTGPFAQPETWPFTCVYTAAWWFPILLPWGTPDAACACHPGFGNNRIRLTARASGEGGPWASGSTAQAVLGFAFPARPQPAQLRVQVMMSFHGFRWATSASDFPCLLVDAEAMGTQSGVDSGQAADVPACTVVAGPTACRIDTPLVLEFGMPVSADPFTVIVNARVRASASIAGSMSLVDFGEGDGNYIDVLWVAATAK